MDNEVLNNLDDLIKESKSSISNDTLIKLAKDDKSAKFIGTINNSGDIENILTARKFLKPSSFYGHMYADNVSTAWNLRQSEGMDIFVTDSNGILKNSVNSDDAFISLKSLDVVIGSTVIFFFLQKFKSIWVVPVDGVTINFNLFP